MSEYTQHVAEEIWNALGGSLSKGSVMERIEAVLINELNDLEETLANVAGQGHNPSHADADKRSAYMKGYKDATEAALALVRKRKL
jgi:hypothetical protein